MLPGQASLKTMRDAQRQRSLGLNAQSRLRARHQQGSTSSSSAGVGVGASSATYSGLGRRGPVTPSLASESGWKVGPGGGNARVRAAMEDEVMIAKAATATATSGGESGGSRSEDEEPGRSRGPVETPLEELVTRKPPRASNLTHDYEVIPPRARVIALAADDFGPSTTVSTLGFPPAPRHVSSGHGASSSSSEDDDWEMLGIEDELVAPRVKPQPRTWASIVSRA